jgi:hypothetical protein
MSIALVQHGWMLLVMMPRAVLLSVWMGVGGCLCPISLRRCRMGIASRKFMYSAPSLALAALDMTALGIFGDVEHGPIVGWIIHVR